MKNRLLFLTLISVVFLFPAAGLAKNKDPLAATPNLSFPVVATDVIEMFYQQIWVDDGDGLVEDNEWVLGYDSDENGVVDTVDPTAGVLVPIAVTEDVDALYTGSYVNQVEPDGSPVYQAEYVLDATTGCFVDLVENEADDDPLDDDLADGVPDVTETLMTTWLADKAPWYPQPRVTTDADPNLIWNTEYVSNYANSWQADWVKYDGVDANNDGELDKIKIDFIDWGNPMENTYPLIGYRFPVEIALYQKLATPMRAFKMACLENPGTKIELFGTSDGPRPYNDRKTFDSYYATVLTNKFIAEVWNPDGTIERIDLGPGIGPSGKMNFASAVGGWVPKMEGVHRIWLHVTDPLITFEGAIINNDEHYVMSTLCGPAELLAPNKIALTGIIDNSTFIDVTVKKPNSSGGRK